MAPRITIVTTGGSPSEYEGAFRRCERAITAAVMTAFRETGKSIASVGRADIRAGGFTTRWQRGLTARVLPLRAPRQLAAADVRIKVRHKLPFIAVFENGATIRGKPFLWLPLSGVPQKLGGKRMTPRLFSAQIGKLAYVKRPGKAPLLVGPAKGVRGGRVGHAALRRGAAHGGQNVPIFVGVKLVHLHKRIHTTEIVQNEASMIAGRYAAAMARETI